MSKYYVIPKTLASQFKQIVLVWHTGVDAVEIEDGNYILSEASFNLLNDYKHNITVSEKQVQATVELKKYPLVDEKDITWKTYDEPVVEPKEKTIR